jgi:hypothetical protein
MAMGTTDRYDDHGDMVLLSFGAWNKQQKHEARNIVLEDIYPDGLPGPRARKRPVCVNLLAMFGLLAIASAVVVLLVESSKKGAGNGRAAPVEEEKAPAAAPSGPLTPLDDFLSGLPEYSLRLAETNATSPQAHALAWLRNNSDYETHRLYQRYALAVLYYATNGGSSWHKESGWLSDSDECTWYFLEDTQDVCGQDSRFLVLDLWRNGLFGSIPAELELLSNLQRIELGEGAALEVAIHPELYVSRIGLASVLAPAPHVFGALLLCNVPAPNYPTCAPSDSRGL